MWIEESWVSCSSSSAHCCLYFGYQKTGAVTERAKQTITGDYTDRTMLYLVGGAAAGIAGIALVVLGSRR
jgi:hypothetical protein